MGVGKKGTRQKKGISQIFTLSSAVGVSGPDASGSDERTASGTLAGAVIVPGSLSHQ